MTTDNSTPAAFKQGRTITPGTPRQLGAFGLFPPSPSQQRLLKPTTQPLMAKSAEPELLWISFAELCGKPTTTADYLALARNHSTWVIDGVPSPGVDSPLGSAAAWQRFSNVVDVLFDRNITLFLVGVGPFDWHAMGHGLPSAAALPGDLARTASRLSLLTRLESTEELDAIELSGS